MGFFLFYLQGFSRNSEERTRGRTCANGNGRFPRFFFMSSETNKNNMMQAWDRLAEETRTERKHGKQFQALSQRCQKDEGIMV